MTKRRATVWIVGAPLAVYAAWVAGYVVSAAVTEHRLKPRVVAPRQSLVV